MDTAEAGEYVNSKFKALIKEKGHKPDYILYMDKAGLFWKRMVSRAIIVQDESEAPGSKAQKDRVSMIMCGNAEGFIIKPGFINR